MISKKKFDVINNILIVSVLSTIFFRPICTILIFVYALFNLVNLKHLKFEKKILPYFFVLIIPFALEIIFLWNNIGASNLFKPIEKVLSFLIFPLFILLSYKSYNLYKIADYYRKITTVLIIFLMIRFVIIAPDFVAKYLNGNDLWEMGYVFTNSFGNHAPGVNMKVAFLVILNLYFALTQFPSKKVANFLYLTGSIIALLIINTRLSLGSCIVCCLCLFIAFAVKKYKAKAVYFVGIFTVLIGVILAVFFTVNPYMKEKYTKVTFANMDKIGKLDEVENPDGVLHNALVTRVTIWKTAIELGNKEAIFGYGSAKAKDELFRYYEETNQQFLTKYQFPVHNQFIDYYLRFGIIGFMALLYFFGDVFRISILSKNAIAFCFTLNFFFSNLFDDFLLRFDGIVFCTVFISLFYAYYLVHLKKNKFG